MWSKLDAVEGVSLLNLTLPSRVTDVGVVVDFTSLRHMPLSKRYTPEHLGRCLIDIPSILRREGC